MASFLINQGMAPALRARIVESLRTDALARAGGANRRKGNFLFRALVLCAVVVTATFLVSTYRQAEREFVQEKSTLLKRYEQQRGSFDARFFSRLDRIDEILTQASAPYEGDFFAEEFRHFGSDALDELLSASVVYLRGPQRGFLTQQDRVRRAVESSPDALVRCLMVPPPDVGETALLRHLGHVYQPSVMRGRFVGLTPAYEAREFLGSTFSFRLSNVESARLLPFLDRDLRRANLPAANKFLEARSFLYVLDEPKKTGVIADFDGEAEHYLRLAIVDIASGQLKLRLRALVDPQWISDKSRLSYSRELDSCRLAHEIRNDLDSKTKAKGAREGR